MTRTNPALYLTKSLPKQPDAVVVGLTRINDNQPAFVGITAELDKLAQRTYGHSIAQLATASGATSDLEAITLLPAMAGTKVLVVGLGVPDTTPSAVRSATGAALRTLAGLAEAKAWHVAISLELSDPELLQAAGEGALLGSYSFAKLSAAPHTAAISAISLLSSAPGTTQKAAVDTARITAEAVCQTRDWINTPPNLLYPETFAEQAKQLLRNERISVEILDEKALAKAGYGGLLAVGGGSSRAPRLVRMSYAPRGAKHHIALIGKGITFDSGGLDIKPAGQMAAMKTDMSGAATVICALQAIAQLGLKVQVTAYAALAENMPSGTAYRSSDVITMFDGQTVENYNTDAEGRLVMADAIARAGLDKPDLIIDVATLTGACMVALGTRIAGLITNSPEATELLLDAAETAGEDLWELPLNAHIRSELKSSVADMRSGAGHRYGGALVAGAFLERFVPAGVSWAHLDIAGPAANDGAAYGYVVPGGTGVAVRTLVATAQSLSS